MCLLQLPRLELVEMREVDKFMDEHNLDLLDSHPCEAFKLEVELDECTAAGLLHAIKKPFVKSFVASEVYGLEVSAALIPFSRFSARRETMLAINCVLSLNTP